MNADNGVKPRGQTVLLQPDLEREYAEMASGLEREEEALAWSEGLIGDVAGEHPKVAL